ncbi:ATPase [Pseudoalteromonas spongiae]|uniref:ATPase n=1 Tax=Pseudoalteromonas spongiae TaxID=298657 RepID=UPI000C2D073B|nr:ATPase [Pseudoalteromonas spongiae]
MTELYGLTKLALLNTAGYAKCVIPLNKSSSICAPNNTGKSSVINALQFPLINDLRLTEWDGHDLDETRKFYFASDQSYILLEAELPHGPVVIGVAGLGKVAGYGYQYFCYHGKLDLTDYTQNKRILKYTQLFKELGEKGYVPYELKAQELNALLTGGATPFDSVLNLKMIPLNHAHDAPIYKEIFRRILNLHKLGAQDVKRFMLKVFERHMSNAKVDFYDVWQRAFEKVNRAKIELKALEQNGEAITALESMLEHQSALKGKLAAFAPKIDKALIDYSDFNDNKLIEITEQLEGIESEKIEFEQRQSLYVGQLREIERKRTQLDAWFSEFSTLKNEFELVNEAQLKAELSQVKKEYDALSHTLASAEGQSLVTLDFRIKDATKQIKSLKQQLKNLEYNLFTRMREDLSLKEVEDISCLLNHDIMTMATSGKNDITIHDETAFSELLDLISRSIEGNVAKLPGIDIPLKGLSALKMQSGDDKETIKAQINAFETSLKELLAQKEVAVDLEGKKQEKETLYQTVMAHEAALSQYAKYTTMLASIEAQELLLSQLESEQDEVEGLLSEVQNAVATIADRRSIIKANRDMLARQSARLAQVKSERIDHTLDFYSGKSTPYPIDITIDFDNLADLIHGFNKDCHELRNFAVNVSNTYLHIYNAGLTKFDGETDEYLKYQKVINAYHNLDNEQQAVERQARVALTEVAATIKGLREDLDRLRREMNSFNSGISQHRISNLKSFKIEVLPRKQLIESIDTIISTSNKLDNGDTLDLLSQQAFDEKEINRAKDHLIELATGNGGLTLSDLFDIRFVVVNRAGEQDTFDKIDSAGSNGTRITIKLLCGMLFIRYLLADKEQSKYRIPIYIDEAADIDPQNQQAIIETAYSFGFVPLFASVKPQVSCEYIVPIRTVSDGKQNWVDENDWIAVSDTESNLVAS